MRTVRDEGNGYELFINGHYIGVTFSDFHCEEFINNEDHICDLNVYGYSW